MLTSEIVRQLLDYDPATGVFTWKFREEISHYIVGWNKRFAGKPAGRKTPNKNGYLELAIDGVLYYCHRVAWLYMTGEWPEVNTDHRDTDKSNNRWDNLREATVAQNGHNMKMHRRNKTGLKGVTLYVSGNYRRYVAHICYDGKNRHLGYFVTAKEAHAAYAEAAKKHHGEFARAA